MTHAAWVPTIVAGLELFSIQLPHGQPVQRDATETTTSRVLVTPEHSVQPPSVLVQRVPNDDIQPQTSRPECTCCNRDEAATAGTRSPALQESCNG
ncbi:MAG: hypothetical protein H7Y88_00535 [Phycisphaerales bacterium]|nr:hypothetical protein [Phycisphaerales bacterium]